MSPPTTYTELEIGLHRVEAESYQVELRFSDPASEADVSPARGPAIFDTGELLALQNDAEAYGRALSEGLFHDDGVRGLYARARSAAEASGSFLRLRLLVGASALELHALRWEQLVDPESGAPLATSERTLLSRFMLSRDWRPVKLRPKSELKASVAVAAPSDLERYKLADVDAAGEVGRATAALSGIDVDVAGLEEPLTQERLVAALRGGVDILYLVCHGVLTRKQVPYLFLQDEEGKVARVEGRKLARAVAELRQPPRLVVLASCESAAPSGGTGVGSPGSDRSTPQASLAPRLAEAGVPAILAMQGKISMETVERAMPVFFTELMEDGQVDRAMAVARGVVRERFDAWMPALYLRLKRGRIWYVPGFSGTEDSFSKWRSITSSIRQGRFIPILGPDVDERTLGSSRGLARRLGERYGVPLARHELSDLAKVAQYLSVDQSPKYARDRIAKDLRRQALKRLPELPDAAKLSFPKLLDALITRRDEEDPFRILAQLPASIYVTSSFSPMLVKSLKEVGKEPSPLLCDWRRTPDSHPREPHYEGEPTGSKPIVYHVFGVLGKPSSLVLTEDDFFDYLIATAEHKLIPTAVRGALTRSSLLFLGFHLEDWRFRVLFRLIMALAGCHQLRDFAHVGVQVDPEEHGGVDVEKTRKYLEQYFSANPDTPPISIYWGSAADFLGELSEQTKSSRAEEMATTMGSEDEWVG